MNNKPCPECDSDHYGFLCLKHQREANGIKIYKYGEKYDISKMPTNEEISTILGYKIDEIKNQGHASFDFHDKLAELRKSATANLSGKTEDDHDEPIKQADDFTIYSTEIECELHNLKLAKQRLKDEKTRIKYLKEKLGI